MSLSQSLNTVRQSAQQSIATLIQQGLGMKHPNHNTQVLDLRAFRVTGELDSPYNLEVLFPDNYAVLFISPTAAYDENDNARSLESVFDASLGPLFEALDVLAQYGLPQYEIVLRATVLAEARDVPGLVEFSESWHCYDHDLDDGVHSYRLETLLTVTASSPKAAVEQAKANAPDLGLDEPDWFQVDYWVDTEQAGDIVRLPLSTRVQGTED